jgi:hypothetical protein
LILQLPRRHAVGMRRHEMRRPEPRRQRAAWNDASPFPPWPKSVDRNRGIRTCMPGSSAPRRVARHNRYKQNPSANAAPIKRRRSSPRRGTRLETAKAIGPWPLRARQGRLEQRLNYARIPHLGLPGTAG